VFNQATLAANLAALEVAQGQRPHVEELLPTQTRVVADEAAGARLEIRAADGAWTAVDEPIVTHWPRQIIVIGAALGSVIERVARAGAPTRVLALEPDPGVAGLLLAHRDWTARIADGRLCVLTGPDYRGAMNCARLRDVTEPPAVLASAALLTHASVR